jgi:light-regulated signal transduction histidine kinase (bacteriophytochrome)
MLGKSKDLDPDAKIYAEKMQSSAIRMQEMLKGLLQYSVVTVRGGPFRPIDLNKVVKEVIEDLETSISET